MASPPVMIDWNLVGQGVMFGLVGVAAIGFAPIAAVMIGVAAEESLFSGATSKLGVTLAGDLLRSGGALEVGVGSRNTIQGFFKQ